MSKMVKQHGNVGVDALVIIITLFALGSVAWVVIHFIAKFW